METESDHTTVHYTYQNDKEECDIVETRMECIELSQRNGSTLQERKSMGKDIEQDSLSSIHLDVSTQQVSTTSSYTLPPVYSLSSKLMAVGLMILAGCAVSFQALENTTLNHIGGRSFASVMSFLVGLGCCCLFFIVDVTFLGTPLPSFQKLKTGPIYIWFGGLLGSYYVVINILTVPYLGAGTVLR